MKRAIAVLALAVVAFGLTRLLGVAEGIAVLVGLAVLSGTAWLGPRAVRVVGSGLFAFVLFAFAKPMTGVGVAAVLTAVATAGLARYAPVRVLRRVAFLVPSLILLVYVTILLMYRAPGSPFAAEKVASAQVEAALRATYGVPAGANDFFFVYMKHLVVDGTLGPSIRVQGRTVEGLIGPAVPVSATLGLLALTIATALGLFLGVRAGLDPRSLTDNASMGFALLGVSVPSFVIGAVLMIVFALRLGWFPVAGWGGYRHLWLPAFTLALPHAAYIARLARGGTMEVMQQDFVRTARAKGLPERDVVLRHALRGAILPVVSFLGPTAAGIMTGSFVVETLFAIPGIGQWFVKGAINRDYSVVLGTALLYAGLVTAFNLLVDIVYSWLDPRVRGQL